MLISSPQTSKCFAIITRRSLTFRKCGHVSGTPYKNKNVLNMPRIATYPIGKIVITRVVLTPWVNILFKRWFFESALWCLVDRGLHTAKTNHVQLNGAVEACWAHNPEVGGSKPL